MEEHLLVSKSLGVTILAQVVTYFLVLVAMMALTRFVVWEYFIFPYFFMGVLPIADESAWEYYAYVVLVYTLPMGLVISFINQMNKKFGPGVLIPLLLGKYRNPKEEERTFMFMDLDAKTGTVVGEVWNNPAHYNRWSSNGRAEYGTTYSQAVPS